MRVRRVVFVVLAGLSVAGYGVRAYLTRRNAFPPAPRHAPTAARQKLSPMQAALVADLDRQVRANIRYRDAYYSGGEPPATEGVCTDVVIRAFRAAGVDLRSAVADDVRAAGSRYAIEKPDANIDHRRCRNLIVFFRRKAIELPADGPRADWQAGDVVLWSTRNDGHADHIGMIATGRDEAGAPTVVHHWPGFPVRETGGLHAFEVLGHFRWPSGARRPTGSS